MHVAVALASVLAFAGLTGCSSSKTPPKETSSATQPKPERIVVPGAKAGPAGTPNFGGPARGVVSGGGAIASGNTLSPDEGKLAVEAPGDATAGAEATAKVVITPGAKYKVNTEFPTQLTIEAPAGITVAKAQLKAGGPDKAKGDAEAFDEKELTFAVKLTPAQAGTFTVNGTIKFAVCDKDTCLPKKEAVTIAFAAK